MQNLFDTADWYRATTLRERAASVQHGEPGEMDPERAELAASALDRWRGQTPFQQEEILERRLATDNLSGEDFLALLGEPAEALKNRLAATPLWLAELAAAFGDPDARLGEEGARQLG